MAALRGVWIGLLLGFTHCDVNLSRRRTTTLSQSSTYTDHIASRANDGDIRTKEGFCAHTDPQNTNTTAWFQVDLGKPYSIKSVKIYYRREGDKPGDWIQHRFRQFYLDVSDSPATSTITSQRTRCYTDTGLVLPPNIIEIPCKQTARYIIVETKYIYPGDPGPILEICEIEVIGNQCNPGCFQGQCNSDGYCTEGCVNGYWGNTCNEQCPSTCSVNYCYRNGNCFFCKPNYTGNKCDTRLCPNCYQQVCDHDTGLCSGGCVAGYYGSYCSKRCSEQCDPQTCHSSTGDCTNNCTNGYHGPKCESLCSTTCSTLWCRKIDGECVNGCQDMYYGFQCRQQCSQQCKNNICNLSNGHCDRGCKDGFYGDFCNQNCNINCVNRRCNQTNGFCSDGCTQHWAGNTCNSCLPGYFGYNCDNTCSSCSSSCDRWTGDCSGECRVGYHGKDCSSRCNTNCKNTCNKNTGACDNGCVDGKFGNDCQMDCSFGCDLTCEQNTGNCTCKQEWQGYKCNECRPDFYGANCTEKCSSHCVNGHCHAMNGTCLGGCKSGFLGDQCGVVLPQSTPSDVPVSAIGVGVGILVFVIVAIIIIILLKRFRRQKSDKKSTTHVSYSGNNINISRADNKLYTNIGNVSVPIEDPEEEPQIENPEEAMYYNDLSVAKDIVVSNLMNVIREKEAKENEGFLKEFKSLPYGERFACDTAKTDENMPKNRFKTTFPYDHSRVVLEVGKGFASDYINANYIENMEGKREFIACQGPRENTLVDHWRMIWQEHVEYIVMLTNLIEGPKVKCHQYWPDEGKELDINPFSVTLVEEKVYAYFVERKMTVHKKRVTGSRTVVQYHYTRWPDHGTPNPLNLVVFHRHFRHKIKSTQHPIIVHCSAGIGRTGTFIALDVLSRYGKDKGKVNVIEYVKAMRRDRMTMIQNVDQYVFLYHALYEYFRRKAQYRKKDEFLSLYIDVNKPDTQKQITNEFNELISLKPRYDAKDFKSGKKYSKLNLTKSVLPVEQYLVYLTSHVPGRESYYNAVNVSSFTRADEFISAQLPVPGAAIDLVRVLLDHETEFLISLNPLSEFKELQSWVEENVNPVKLSPFTITKDSQTTLSKDIRKTSIKIIKKEENEETHDLQIFECLNWSSSEILPKETSSLTNLIKQFSLDRKSHSSGHVTVISKDGATCCGVFIAVYNAIEQLQQDDEVDIFTIVQQLQCRRPEMISTKEEYEFCFRAAADFLNTDSVYANT